jgi:hypothetical protein
MALGIVYGGGNFLKLPPEKIRAADAAAARRNDEMSTEVAESGVNRSTGYRVTRAFQISGLGVLGNWL